MMSSKQKPHPITPAQFDYAVRFIVKAVQNLGQGADLLELYGFEEFAKKIREIETKLDEIIREVCNYYKNALEDEEYREAVRIVEELEARQLLESPEWLFPWKVSIRPRIQWCKRPRVMLDLRKA
jgi:single-stranded DNA-specific DHH superfamily exonuclease